MSEDILEKQLIEIIRDEEMAEHIKVAKIDMLVRLGVDVNVMCGAKSPLRFAKDNNLEKLVELLENNGAKDVFDEKIAKELGVKLIKACKDEEKKDVKEIKELIDMGADVNQKNEDEWTALLYALFYGHKEIAEILIKNGANVNQKGKGGRTVLMEASHEGDKEIVELLIKNGADINGCNEYGTTALMLASMRNHKEIVELLIQNGADVNARTRDGGTALMEASAYGYKEIIELLIQNGADVNAMNYLSLRDAMECANDAETREVIIKAVKKREEKARENVIIQGFERE